MSKLKQREENRIFFNKFFESTIWKATGITVNDKEYNKLNRINKLVFIRNKMVASEKGKKIVANRLTKSK